MGNYGWIYSSNSHPAIILIECPLMLCIKSKEAFINSKLRLTAKIIMYPG